MLTRVGTAEAESPGCALGRGVRRKDIFAVSSWGHAHAVTATEFQTNVEASGSLPNHALPRPSRIIHSSISQNPSFRVTSCRSGTGQGLQVPLVHESNNPPRRAHHDLFTLLGVHARRSPPRHEGGLWRNVGEELALCELRPCPRHGSRTKSPDTTGAGLGMFIS